MVDVDDREDQKYASRLTSTFGERLGGSWAFKASMCRLALMMQKQLSKASLVWFIASEDAWTVPGTRTAIVPNMARTSPAKTDPSPPSQGNSILFVGIYSHASNRDGISWFLSHCWPELSRRFPQTRLHIVGRGMLWHEMAARYTHLERVDFVGDAVPWSGVAGADRHRDARRGPA